MPTAILGASGLFRPRPQERAEIQGTEQAPPKEGLEHLRPHLPKPVFLKGRQRPSIFCVGLCVLRRRGGRGEHATWKRRCRCRSRRSSLMVHSCIFSELVQPPWLPRPPKRAWKGRSILERKQSRSGSCGKEGKGSDTPHRLRIQPSRLSTVLSLSVRSPALTPSSPPLFPIHPLTCVFILSLASFQP